MKYVDRIAAFIERMLDLFDLVKGYIEDALSFFEKLKELVLELLEYIKVQFDQLTNDENEELRDEEIEQLLEQEHFFI
ncbi:hypothetical protein [Flavobacterium sp. NKUCC04_CG]|uniref:hypothetical protein n=1 Tax=Flavobacterium sp. NKUCC04_CG TaxID=2842121 RepID=UPI001C5B68D5|nr:hypothetical protein [Flavobacterium sp. NKUCC04_CG]MBW3518112.1 hypothetical protein [Flavobacterium sp. NKUCC04_CG]